MTQELQASEYKILDKMDEEQIKKAGEQLKQSLVYEMTIRGNKVKQITFIGLKWLTVKMAQGGQALEIISAEVKLDKDDPNNEKKWYWRAIVRTKNQKTGLETEGVAECPYLMDQKKGEETIKVYDPFARTKAHSKAERNSWRKQIPEVEILELLKTAKGDDVQNVKTPNNSEFCTCKPEERIVTPDKGGCSKCHKKLTPIVQQELLKQ